MAEVKKQTAPAAKKSEPKVKQVTVLKTIQVKPGSEPLPPGTHTLDAGLADELIESGFVE